MLLQKNGRVIKILICTCIYVQLAYSADLPLPVLSDIQLAQKRIEPVVRFTPLIGESALSKISQANVFLKLENLQYTGSFKTRGSYNKIASLSDVQRKKGVIAASAGNHAQGVALAAEMFGIPATIVMPVNVPETKYDATKSYGANVVLFGDNFNESLEKALKLSEETNALFIHPFDDPLTIAGQGTIGLEIVRDLPDVDVVLIPVGGGGLASGIAIAVKSLKPDVEIIGVEPEKMPSMKEALKIGEPCMVENQPTVAEGTAVAKVGRYTHKVLRDRMSRIVTVTENEINQGIRLLLLKDKILAEGAGALGAAAILSNKLDLKGKNVVIVISGGNIDVEELLIILEAE